MADPSVDLEEVAKDIAYVIPHVSSAGGYKSMVVHLTPDEKGDARFTECTKTVEQVAETYKRHGLVYLDGNIAINLKTVSGIEASPVTVEATNYNVFWLLGNKPLVLPVRIPEDRFGKLLAGALRGAPERRATRRGATHSRPAARIA